MLTYSIIILGIVLICTFAILDKLRTIQRTQLEQTKWLQNMMGKTGDPTPVMLTPYLKVMTDEQNHRYRQWILGLKHEPFTITEIHELEKNLALKGLR